MLINANNLNFHALQGNNPSKENDLISNPTSDKRSLAIKLNNLNSKATAQVRNKPVKMNAQSTGNFYTSARQGMVCLMPTSIPAYAHSEWTKSVNTDYANLANSEDKWLERDINFMAHALRNAHNEKIGNIKTDTAFSADDLTALSLVTHIFGSLNFDDTLHGSDTTVGLSLAMKYLKSMEIADKLNASSEMLDVISDFADSFIERLIEIREAREKQNLELGLESIPFNRNNVYSIINFTKESLERTGNAVLTLQEITAFAFKQFQANSANAPQSCIDFWNNFYDNGSGKSGMGDLLNDWNEFSSALDKGDYKRLA
jgi:hypothetical protein